MKIKILWATYRVSDVNTWIKFPDFFRQVSGEFTWEYLPNLGIYNLWLVDEIPDFPKPKFEEIESVEKFYGKKVYKQIINNHGT